MKTAVHFLLSRRGIDDSEISVRFAEIEKLLSEAFGTGGETILTRVLSRLCEEYSLGLDLSYANTLSERLSQVKERVLVDKLIPKHSRREVETRSYEDKTGLSAPWAD